MAEAFTGEIRMMAFRFAPYGWADCNGQILQIQQQTALFSLLGDTFGGDGRVTFGLPNLIGRSPMHQGRGPGLSQRIWGADGGSAGLKLDSSEIPPHDHQIGCSTDTATLSTPVNNYPALQKAGRVTIKQFGTESNNNMQNTGITGSNNPHENRPPFLVVRMCICLEGVYPSRN